MATLNCIIVDDESNALDVLETYITSVNFLRLVGRCSDAQAATEIMQSTRVDAVFLDVEMPELSGIDFMRALSPKPKVIFTTAYREHAVEAFELNAVDYLLKPFSFQRFLEAAKRLLPQPSPTTTLPLTIYHNRKHVHVDMDSICYIQAMGNYAKIHTTSELLITYESIGSLLAKLPPALFVQVHKSFIVNRAKIKHHTSVHVAVEGMDIPIGRMFKKNVGLMKRNDEE